MLDILRIVALAATVNAIRLRDPAAGTYQKPIATYKTDECAGVVTPPNPNPWTEDFFDGVKVDHFSATSKRAFRQRILYSNSTYKKDGPMFFYTGNEGDILSFAQNTGVIWNIASQFNAFVVFAEHRFYGESQPFPVQAAFSSADKLQYLTVEQALADYAALIPRIKQKYGLPNDTKVIAVGGSYGGMLSAWFRHTYPQVVDGAWAASAPVEYFATGTVPLGAFDKRTKDTLMEGGCDSGTIQDSFNAIDLIATRPTGYAQLNSAFNIDPKSLINSTARVQDLKDYVAEGLTYMAMTDYPYQSNFLENMTAWPVKVACQYLNGTEAGTNRELIIKMGKAIAVYYGNGTNCIDPTVCGDQGTSGLGANTDLAWSWQACTELILYSCEQGPPNDLFWQQCTNATGSKNPPTFENWSKANCQLGEQGVKGYNATTMWNETKIPSKFGLDFAGASNIIFTNGNLDPWSPGGVKPSTPGFSDALKRNIFIYEIEGGAHHLDLREPNTCDPEPVRNVRWQIVKILKCWTGLRPASECTPVLLHEPVPPFSQANTTNCVTDAYPWGQGRPPVTTTSKHTTLTTTKKHTTLTTTKKHTVTTETTKTTTATVHHGTESTKATAPARNHTSSGQTSPPGQSGTTPKGASTVVISLKAVLFSMVLSFFALRH